jgi:hypothetical protein
MHLVELLLPLRRSDGAPVAQETLQQITAELRERFGGFTAHLRAPAVGVWQAPEGHADRDEIVIVEVMAHTFDEAWWKAFRERLEDLLDQRELLIRAHPVVRV